jgi:hypothetical protein
MGRLVIRKRLRRFTVRQIRDVLDISDRTIANWRIEGRLYREPLEVVRNIHRRRIFILEWHLLHYLETYRPDLRKKWDDNLHLMRPEPNPLPRPYGMWVKDRASG